MKEVTLQGAEALEVLKLDDAFQDERREVLDATKMLIDAQDYVGLQRLYARLKATPTFDSIVYDEMTMAAATAGGQELMMATRFACHIKAMHETGRSWRG